MKVVVALSGGVDSAVAALRLLDEGHEVIGVHLRMGRGGAGAVDSARRVARQLAIGLLEVDCSEAFDLRVVRPALGLFASGVTPSPCVVCNERLKLAELERVAAEVGADMVATGHYARVEGSSRGPLLLRGADRSKDQSYFLHRLTASRLRRIAFPLGDFSKDEVRGLAARAHLSVAGEKESQELCFVADGGSPADLVEAELPERVRPGRIVDREGQRLGDHGGVHRFTVGQRRGAPHPLYVLAVDAADGTVVVGPRDQAEASVVHAEGVSWVNDAPPDGRLECSVQIRSRHSAAQALVEVEGSKLTIRPAAPLLSPAPGQAAVLYRSDQVLGGAWIVRGNDE